MNYFITIPELKEHTNISTNVSDAEIKPFIKVAYDIYILDYLCDEVAEDLLNKYNSNHVWSPGEIDLLKLIKDVMYWGVSNLVGLYSTYPLSAKGFQQQDGQYSSSIDYATVGALRKQLLNIKDEYVQRLINHLCKNEICNKCDCGDTPKTLKNIFFV